MSLQINLFIIINLELCDFGKQMVLSFNLAAQHFCQNHSVRAQVAQIHISKQWMFRNPWRIQKHREGIRPGLDFSEVRLEN